MKKADFIEMVAEKAQESKAAVARVVDAIFDASSGAIAETVKAGREVSIPGFGKFRSRKRAARKGRNPQTGKEISIPASTVVAFSAGKGFKDSVAGRTTAKKKTAKAGGATAKGSGAAKGGTARKSTAGTGTGAKAAAGKSASKSAGTKSKGGAGQKR